MVVIQITPSRKVVIQSRLYLTIVSISMRYFDWNTFILRINILVQQIQLVNYAKWSWSKSRLYLTIVSISMRYFDWNTFILRIRLTTQVMVVIQIPNHAITKGRDLNHDYI